MNSRIFSSLFTLSLLSAAVGAQAQVASQDLDVTGTLRTPVCTVNAQGDGIYEYGNISSNLLPAGGHYTLPMKSHTWTVDCGSGTTYLSMWPQDNREGTASDGSGTGTGGHASQAFGLGRMDGRATSQIGYYVITAANARVDGVATQVGTYSPSRQAVYVAASEPLRPRDGDAFGSRAITWANGFSGVWHGVDAMVAGSTFEVDLEVRPYLASHTVVGGGAPVTERVNIDGSATLTFQFGL